MFQVKSNFTENKILKDNYTIVLIYFKVNFWS